MDQFIKSKIKLNRLHFNYYRAHKLAWVKLYVYLEQFDIM